VGAGVIVYKSPGAVHEFAAFGFAFDSRGTCRGRNEFGEVGFRYRAFEAGEVASDQGDYIFRGELIPET
jgi:hypothetical protein